MKLLDAAFGRLASSIMSSPAKGRHVSPIRSILLIRPGGIGDAVLLAPVIHAIKNIHPCADITVLAERRNTGVFELIPAVDTVLCYDQPGEFVRTLKNKFDVIIDTEQWHRLSAVVARIISAPLKIGYDTNERRRMFTHPVPYSHDDHESVSFAHLLEPMGISAVSVEMDAPFLIVPHAVAGKAAGLLEPLRDEPFVAIFPGASILERQWGAERFRRVAEMVFAFGIRTVVVGGTEDRHQGEGIIEGGLGLNLAGRTSLAETAAVIQKSALLLSGDSGVLHIAVGLGVPTVSLFGPGRAKKWAPQGDRHSVINKNLPCSPCTTFGTTPPCTIHARCMRDITADEVANALTMLLTSVGAVSSRCCKRDRVETKG